MVESLFLAEYHNFLWYVLFIYFPTFCVILIISGIVLFIDCSSGHYWAAHYTMAIFSFILIIIEIIVYIKRPYPWSEKAIKGSCKCIRRIISSETVAWGFQALFAFLGHFDIYTDLCFIMVASDSSAQYLWIASLVLFIIAYLPKLLAYIWMLFVCCKRCFKNLVEDMINEIQQTICYAFELKHHIHILNTIDFEIEKKIRNKLYANVWKFLSEDLGQFIIQLMYMLNRSEYCPEEEGVNFILYISLVLSAIMGLYSFITPILDKFSSKISQDQAQMNHSEVYLYDRMEKGKEEEFCDLVCRILENNRVQRLYLGIIYLFLCVVNR